MRSLLARQSVLLSSSTVFIFCSTDGICSGAVMDEEERDIARYCRNNLLDPWKSNEEWTTI